MGYQRLTLGAMTALGVLYLGWQGIPQEKTQDPERKTQAQPDKQGGPGEGKTAASMPADDKLSPSVLKALGWLANAQHKDGGFGGGSHSRQDVRDVHAVPSDPATTAVAAIAFLRAGNGLELSLIHI